MSTARVLSLLVIGLPCLSNAQVAAPQLMAPRGRATADTSMIQLQPSALRRQAVQAVRPGAEIDLPTRAQADEETVAHQRRRFAAWGAIVGAVGLSAYMVSTTKDGLFGYGSAIVAVPLGVAGGVVVGGIAGYAISFVVVPRASAR